MSASPGDTDYVTDASGQVRIRRGGSVVTVLRAGAARRFLARVDAEDPQLVMAKATGNYKRGNERAAKRHPRNALQHTKPGDPVVDRPSRGPAEAGTAD